MKRLFVFHFLAFCALPSTVFAEESWKPVSDKDGVAVWQRRVEGSKVMEVRGEAVMDAPAERVFAVLGDVDSYPQLMPPTTVAKRIKGEGSSVWYYMVIDPPMVRDRDYCIRMNMLRLPDGKLRSEWAVSSEDCPAQTKGMIRIEQNTGHWLLTPLADGRTHVYYQSHTDPGGAVPKWIVNRVTAQTVPKILDNVRRAAALPRYAKKI